MCAVAQVRLASLVENNFNAVERVSEYGQLEEEAPPHIEGSQPPGWPSRGEVRFQLLHPERERESSLHELRSFTEC